MFTLCSVEQADETWLAEFKDQISTPWDFTAVHINKNSLDGVKKDIVMVPFPLSMVRFDPDFQGHFMKYGKPIWVTEFACVDGR